MKKLEPNGCENKETEWTRSKITERRWKTDE